MFATDVSDGSARFHGLQDRDDLVLTEFALPRLGLLASYSPRNLYFSMVPVFREGYTYNMLVTIFTQHLLA